MAKRSEQYLRLILITMFVMCLNKVLCDSRSHANIGLSLGLLGLGNLLNNKNGYGHSQVIPLPIPVPVSELILFAIIQ